MLGSDQGMLAQFDACSPASVLNSWIVDCVRMLMIALIH